MHNLGPECRRVGFLGYLRMVGVNGELLPVRYMVYGRLHESVVNPYGYVRAGNLAFGHFGINKFL